MTLLPLGVHSVESTESLPAWNMAVTPVVVQYCLV